MNARHTMRIFQLAATTCVRMKALCVITIPTHKKSALRETVGLLVGAMSLRLHAAVDFAWTLELVEFVQVVS